MNDKEKTDNDDDVVDTDIEAWVSMNKDVIEWMTESTNNNMNPRSDCG